MTTGISLVLMKVHCFWVPRSSIITKVNLKYISLKKNEKEIV